MTSDIPRKAFVDGSNVLLCLLDRGKPSAEILVALINELERRGFEAHCLLEQSLRHHFKRLNAVAEWEHLAQLVSKSSGRLTFHKYVDPVLLALADNDRANGAVVVNAGDRYTEWLPRFPNGLPPIVRVSFAANSLAFCFDDNSAPAFAAALARQVDGVIKPAPIFLFQSSTGGDAMLSEKLLKDESQLPGATKINHVIFLLDGSGSMVNRDDDAYVTYDKRSKAQHVTEIFRDSVKTLNRASVRASVYCSLISFAGKPTIVGIDGHKVVHVDHFEKYVCDPEFDYAGFAKENGTDIAAAIETSVALVSSAVADPDSMADGNRWSVTFILITDARENSSTDSAVSKHKLYKIVGKLGLKSGPLSKVPITVGCVGIGENVDLETLTTIASRPTTETLQNLGKHKDKNLTSLLLQRDESPCLAITASFQDPRLQEVVRAFVDVVTKTTTGAMRTGR